PGSRRGTHPPSQPARRPGPEATAGPARSGRERPAVPGEQGHLPNIGRAGEAGRPALESDGEPPVRRHAVAEGLEVPGVGTQVGAFERGEVVAVTMQTLAAGNELEAAEQQVEAVRRARPLRVRVRV